MRGRLRVGLLGPVLALTALTPSEAANEFRNQYPDTTASRDCGDDDTVDYGGPLKLWPPNHKLQTVTITATDGDGDGVTLTVTPTVTDVAGGDGGENHDPDVIFPDGPAASGEPSATVPVQLRSERSGKGEGRTYTLDWTATFDDAGKTCTSSDSGQSPFVVTVPHDMRGGRR